MFPNARSGRWRRVLEGLLPGGGLLQLDLLFLSYLVVMHPAAETIVLSGFNHEALHRNYRNQGQSENQ